MFGVWVDGHYLRLCGDTVSYAWFPFDTVEATVERAKSAVLSWCWWYVVDDKGQRVEA